MKCYLISFFLFCYCTCICQVNLYQDVWKGGVKVNGVSSGMTYLGNFTIDLSIPPQATLKKIFLITNSQRNPDSTLLQVNSTPVEINSLNLICSVNHLCPYITPVNIYYKDITSLLLNEDLTNITVSLNSSCPNIINCGFNTVSFIVLYEDANLPEITFSLLIPNLSLIGQESYSLVNLNPVNTSFPVGLSIFMDRSCNYMTDASNVYVNNNFLGAIYGEDIQHLNYMCSGTQGDYIYENQTLTALEDDNIDLAFQHTDALGDISSLLTMNNTDFNLILEHNNLNGSSAYRNIYTMFPLSYISNCSEINVSLSKDTTICEGETVQLVATGGIAYEWLASTSSSSPPTNSGTHVGLNCYDCPNPIFSGNSSQLYTVRIWSSDSCSVVRPIMVKVNPKPTFNSFYSSKTDCGFATGNLSVSSYNAINYNLDNTFSQIDGQFHNLNAGNHSIKITDINNCFNDTLFLIKNTINVNAFLSATPTLGNIPLSVSLQNESVNSTDYTWNINGILQNNPINSVTFDSIGTYSIELIAFAVDSTCSDTAWVTITVNEHLIMNIPNIITSNNDKINDCLGITTNQDVEIKITLLNRWGNKIVEKNQKISSGIYTEIWDGTSQGNKVSDGIYFYTIIWKTINDNGKTDGFITVINN
ncbi:MAG: gliding motility-associated C-terminal domain-containing protein [Flavobacteriia bacterium]|nr:gliding motility-associated C-terminal domain-containing protein [Flavobacteriia bacterium]